MTVRAEPDGSRETLICAVIFLIWACTLGRSQIDQLAIPVCQRQTNDSDAYSVEAEGEFLISGLALSVLVHISHCVGPWRQYLETTQQIIIPIIKKKPQRSDQCLMDMFDRVRFAMLSAQLLNPRLCLHLNHND